MMNRRIDHSLEICRADAVPAPVSEQIASARIGQKEISVRRAVSGLALWVEIGNTRVDIPLGRIIEDAIILAEQADIIGGCNV